MSVAQNLPVNLKVVDQFLDSFGKDPETQAAAAKAMIAELKEQRQALNDGYTRKELTVCVGRVGFVNPHDIHRLIRDEIPRITVYRKKKDNHHMPLFFKNTPRFYKEHAPCKNGKKSTPSSNTATRAKAAKPRASSGRKRTPKQS